MTMYGKEHPGEVAHLERFYIFSISKLPIFIFMRVGNLTYSKPRTSLSGRVPCCLSPLFGSKRRNFALRLGGAPRKKGLPGGVGAPKKVFRLFNFSFSPDSVTLLTQGQVHPCLEESRLVYSPPPLPFPDINPSRRIWDPVGKFPNFPISKLFNFAFAFGSVILLTRNQVRPFLGDAVLSIPAICRRKQRNFPGCLRGLPHDHVRARTHPGKVGKLEKVSYFRTFQFSFSFGSVILLTQNQVYHFLGDARLVYPRPLWP